MLGLGGGAATLRISVSADFSDIRRKFAALGEGEIARRAVIAVNKTAGQARSEIYTEMSKVFDRPTPFVLNSLWVDVAKQNDLRATIYPKGFYPSNPSARPYGGALALEAEIGGGARRYKKFEAALMARGILDTGYQVVPAPGLVLDAFGNMPKSLITQILSWFAGFSEQGYSANKGPSLWAKARKGTRSKYGYEFVAVLAQGGRTRPGHKLHPGIWKRTFLAHGAALKPVVFFIRPSQYRRRLPFVEIVDRVVRRDIAGNFKDAFSRAPIS